MSRPALQDNFGLAAMGGAHLGHQWHAWHAHTTASFFSSRVAQGKRPVTPGHAHSLFCPSCCCCCCRCCCCCCQRTGVSPIIQAHLVLLPYAGLRPLFPTQPPPRPRARRRPPTATATATSTAAVAGGHHSGCAAQAHSGLEHAGRRSLEALELQCPVRENRGDHALRSESVAEQAG